jgi:hypothetical protein
MSLSVFQRNNLIIQAQKRRRDAHHFTAKRSFKSLVVKWLLPSKEKNSNEAKRVSSDHLAKGQSDEPYSPSDLYVSGYSWDGQMGTIRPHTGPIYDCPAKIKKFCLEPINSFSLGLYHVLVLSEQGICYSWGGEYQNQVTNSLSLSLMFFLNMNQC